MKIQELEQRPEYNTNRVFKKRKKRRKFRFLKFMFTLVLFTAGIVFFALSQLFNITAIEVKGSTRYQQEQIVGITGLALGNNAFRSMGSNIGSIMRFRYLDYEYNIKKSFPYIKDVAVKYIIPGKVLIQITERVPDYVVMNESTYFLMDGEGVLIDIVQDIKAVNLQTIKGLKFDVFEVGQVLKAGEADKLKYIAKLKDAIEESDKEDTYKLLSKLNYYDVSDLKRISIMVDSRIIIDFGNLQDLVYRIRYAKYLLQKAISIHEKGYLDFSGGDNPRFIPENTKAGG